MTEIVGGAGPIFFLLDQVMNEKTTRLISIQVVI